MERALHSSGMLRGSRLLWIASKQGQANGVSFTTNRRILKSSVEGVENINPLTSNDPYRGRTAPLTSKVAFYIFIQQI